MDNISELKHYSNFRESGQGVLDSYLSNLLNCRVSFQQQKISDFEKAMFIDVTTTVKRSVYIMDDDKVVITIKVIESSTVIAIMPIILRRKDIASVPNRVFEQLASAITQKITQCYLRQFHGGTQLMGIELENLVIAKVFSMGVFDPARFSFLISYLDKLSHTTFEGQFFTTGFILSRSLYDYEKGISKKRNGILYSLNKDIPLVRNPKIEKRFWYLVDGKQKFYLFDQNLVIKNAFSITTFNKSWDGFFDSYFLKSVIYGKDIVFRTLCQNRMSIMNADNLEFVKIENVWKLRDYSFLNDYIKKHIRIGKRVYTALIYYVLKCSQEEHSSIIWIPKDSTDAAINKYLLTKNSVFKPNKNILSNMEEETIMRILTSDGVTVIDKKGTIIYHGGIVNLSASTVAGLAGTGETATKILSDNGIAIKISQDGNIKIFTSSKEEPMIF